MINFFVEDVALKLQHKQVLKSWIKATAAEHGKKIGEINYIFCSDEYLLQINKEYLNHDYYTDIITFDNSESVSVIDADIYISVDRVGENSKNNLLVDKGSSFENELYRVMIHGILHLLGYKDKSKEEAITMRKLENDCLKKLII